MFITNFAGGMFTVIPMIVAAGFLFVFGTLIFMMIRGVMQWNRNNHAEVITRRAVIVSKRNHISYHTHANNHPSSSSTTYYVTFEFENQERVEFCVAPQEFGLLAERDEGQLTYQGTRYLGFERYTRF